VFWPISSPETIAAAPAPALSEPPPKPPEPLTRCPVLWGDWPRSQIRRRWLKIMRTETVSLTLAARPTQECSAAPGSPVLTRPQRAHWRLSWQERLVRTARPAISSPLLVTIHGLPATFASSFGLTCSLRRKRVPTQCARSSPRSGAARQNPLYRCTPLFSWRFFVKQRLLLAWFHLVAHLVGLFFQKSPPENLHFYILNYTTSPSGKHPTTSVTDNTMKSAPRCW
jgi:hypothetical protein